MKKVLSFGEILIRQQSVGQSFFQSPHNLLKIYPGGSEANVACSLGKLGQEVQFVSAFPDNALSKEIIEILKDFKVDTSKVIWNGDRLGSYILLSGNGLSTGEVIYDRKYSSFSMLKPSDIDFDSLFDHVDWFHWSALSPALNAEIAGLMQNVLENAKQRGIQVSVDLNYRNKLWKYGKDPIEIMPELISYCDVVMGNIWAANKMLGSPIDETFNRNTAKEQYVNFSNDVASFLFQKFPNIQHIAQTFRFIDRPSHNLFYGTYHTPIENVVSETLETNEVIDRIGSGDAFMAGLIHAIRNQERSQQIIDIATGTGFQKLFVEGDFGNGKYN